MGFKLKTFEWKYMIIAQKSSFISLHLIESKFGTVWSNQNYQKFEEKTVGQSNQTPPFFTPGIPVWRPTQY